MQFNLHATRRTPHGAFRLVQAISVWLMKPRRALSRHSRDARVYGHATTAMDEYRVHPLPPLVLFVYSEARLPYLSFALGELQRRMPTSSTTQKWLRLGFLFRIGIISTLASVYCIGSRIYYFPENVSLNFSWPRFLLDVLYSTVAPSPHLNNKKHKY